MAKTAYKRLEEVRQNGDGQAMRDLLQDDDVSADKELLAQFLMKSIEDGEMAKFEALLDAGPDLTWSLADGYGLLNVAVLYNEPEMIRQLADAGADIHVLDQSENGLLHQAAYHCKSGETEVCQALVDVGCYVDQVNRK